MRQFHHQFHLHQQACQQSAPAAPKVEDALRRRIRDGSDGAGFTAGPGRTATLAAAAVAPVAAAISATRFAAAVTQR